MAPPRTMNMRTLLKGAQSARNRLNAKGRHNAFGEARRWRPTLIFVTPDDELRGRRRASESDRCSSPHRGLAKVEKRRSQGFRLDGLLTCGDDLLLNRGFSRRFDGMLTGEGYKP